MLQGWRFSPLSIIHLKQIYRECGRRGYLHPIEGWSTLLSRYHNGLFQRKAKQGGRVVDIIFLKPPGIFRLFHYTLKFQTKQAFTNRSSTNLCYTTHKFLGLKPRPLDIPHDFFLITPSNSAFRLISPRKMHLLFFQ